MSGDMQINPAIVRVVLMHAEKANVSEAARKAGVSRRQVARWQEKRALLGAQWPTDQDIADWRERRDTLAEKRAKARAHKAAERARERLGFGPAHIDPTGTKRRLQGLFSLGYTAVEIGALMNVTPARVMQIATGHWDRVHVDNAAKVKAICSRLWLTRPVGWKAERQRMWAAQKGWLGLLAWDDDTIDDPAAKPVGIPDGKFDAAGYDENRIERRIAGDRSVRLHRGETAEVARRLIADGMSTRRIHLEYGIKAERYFKVAEIRQGVAA